MQHQFRRPRLLRLRIFLAFDPAASDNRVSALLRSDLTPMATTPCSDNAPEPKPAIESVWRAPLLPVAVLVTTGMVLDRRAAVPLGVSLTVTAAALFAWAVARLGKRTGLPLAYLAVAVGAFGAAYHHARRDLYSADDIGAFVATEPLPVRLRGVLDEEPIVEWQPPHAGLRTMVVEHPTTTTLRVTALCHNDDWKPASGRARLVVSAALEGLHAGDGVEVIGRLSAPHAATNPGEFDYAGRMRDQRIRAVIHASKTPAVVTRLDEGWRRSPTGWLAAVRGWGQRSLAESLPESTRGVATALLLGDGSTMTREDWEKYIQTGVIHVLAISGQHLSILAFFLGWTLRLLHVRPHRSAVIVAVGLFAYALLTGGQPPVLRAAVMVWTVCIALLLRRRIAYANLFVTAWLAAAVLNPADLFSFGCQMSFLCVAVMFWGTSPWLAARKVDPLEREAEKSDPWWRQRCRCLARIVAAQYLFSAAIWFAGTPLVAARGHVVSPVAVLLGPPVVLLTSVALVAGLVLLFVHALCWPLTPIFAMLVHGSLTSCEWLVRLGERLPGGYWYVSDIPEWWLWVSYLVLFCALLFKPLRQRWRWAAGAGTTWLVVGLLWLTVRPRTEELRCTFLAVGHGGCTVLETPDGRVLLYDAGAMTGPDVTRRQIAPFLWHRGIQRIDEVFLSHADLDHFNGLTLLLERFAVGQVSCTPSFAQKNIPGVAVTLAALERHGVPVRILRAGDGLAAGTVTLEVLHPPSTGPDGNENARSLVLLVRHAGHTLLLTGDLEGQGLQRVLGLPAQPVDVLMAPHHGSRAANVPALAEWARPRLVISCQGPPHWPSRGNNPYIERGVPVLGTWPHGAVTVRSRDAGLTVETFVTKQHLEWRRNAADQFP